MIASWDLENRFSYHKPTDETVDSFEMIRKIGYAYAVQINQMCPDGREKDAAMKALDEVVFWSNAAIARGVK